MEPLLGAGCSDSFDETVILGMGANPKPRNRISFEQPHGSIGQANPNRVKWLAFFHPLEEKTRMRWIVAPQFVGSLNPLANVRRQSPKCFQKVSVVCDFICVR